MNESCVSDHIWHMSDKLFSLFPIGKRHWKTLNTLINFTKEVVRDRVENFQQKVADEKHRLAFLDLLLGAVPTFVFLCLVPLPAPLHNVLFGQSYTPVVKNAL